jgi:RimJ/RimL family protein N-acetyltransferase
MSLRVRLRDVREDDLPILFEHQTDPEANRMANFGPRDRDAFMAHWAKILADRTVVARTVELAGRVAGNVVSWVHDDERDVGYWIGRDHWGKGIATAALDAFLTVLEERPLFAHVAEHNVGSIRVLEKCGFASLGRVSVANEEGTELLFRLERSSGLRDDRVPRAMTEPADRPRGAPFDDPLDVAQPDEADPGPPGAPDRRHERSGRARLAER